MAPAEDGGLLNWRNWKIPDSWTAVERDRTPKSPTSGGYDPVNDTMGANSSAAGQLTCTDLNNPVRHPELTIAEHLLKIWQPYLRNVVTDTGAHIFSPQGNACMDFEMRAMECIEYYGAKQGLTACKDWYDDFIECTGKAKQTLRLRAMFKKRHVDNHLEYIQGKRTWDETYEKPPHYNSYFEPWYNEKWSHIEHPQQ